MAKFDFSKTAKEQAQEWVAALKKAQKLGGLEDALSVALEGDDECWGEMTLSYGEQSANIPINHSTLKTIRGYLQRAKEAVLSLCNNAFAMDVALQAMEGFVSSNKERE